MRRQVPLMSQLVTTLLTDFQAFACTHKSHQRVNQERYFSILPKDYLYGSRLSGGLGLPHFEAAITASNALWIYDALGPSWPPWKITFFGLNFLPKGLHTFISHPLLLTSPLLKLPERWHRYLVAFMLTFPEIPLPDNKHDLLEEYIAFNRHIVKKARKVRCPL